MGKKAETVVKQVLPTTEQLKESQEHLFALLGPIRILCVVPAATAANSVISHHQYWPSTTLTLFGTRSIYFMPFQLQLDNFKLWLRHTPKPSLTPATFEIK